MANESSGKIPARRRAGLVSVIAMALWLPLPAVDAQQRPAAQSRRVVGLVAEIHGPPDAFHWERGGRRQEVTLLAPVYAGDRFAVNNDGAQLVLLVSNREQRVTVTHSYVASGPESANVVKLTLEYLASLIEASGHEQRRHSVAAGPVRGSDDVQIPLLAPNLCRLSAGRRRLYLPWTGGQPPFEITIVRESGDPPQTIAHLTGVQERSAEMDVELHPGQYVVAITFPDPIGTVYGARGNFVVVNEAPPIPAAAAMELSDTARRFWEAAMLAAADDGAWTWEAYQRLRGDMDGYPAAAALAGRLAAQPVEEQETVDRHP